MIDLDHPMYQPLWGRLLIVVGCLAWAGFEFYSGASFWGMLFGGAGVYSGYKFFYEFYRRKPAAGSDVQDDRQ